MLQLLLTSKLMAAQAAVQASAVSWAAAGGDSVDAITVSIVGGIFLVLAAAIPAWINTRRREGSDPSTKALIDSNNQRQREFIELTRKYDERGKIIDQRDARIDELETLAWSNGINPHTGERVNS